MCSFGQKPKEELQACIDGLVRMTDAVKTDSASLFLQKGERLIGKFKLASLSEATAFYNSAGDYFAGMMEPAKAHQYYTLGLNNGRKFKHTEEQQRAWTSLNVLHKKIREKDLAFDYPQVAETERATVYFPVSKTTEDGDSLLVQILGGTLDGIASDLKSFDLYTHIKQKDTTRPSDITFIESGRVISVSKNFSIVKLKRSELKIIPGDLAVCFAQVPLAWRNISVRSSLLRNLYLVDNYKLYPYHYRYYYYFSDSLSNAESFSVYSNAVNEIIELYAPDTLTNKQLGDKIATGIFAGYNAITAMAAATPYHLQLFLNYVNTYPGKYMSNNYRFSETFATWIINNTPLDPADTKPYLLSFKTEADLLKQTALVIDQVRDDKKCDEWFNEGMQFIITDDFEEARNCAKLLNAAILGGISTFDAGWHQLLLAQLAHRNEYKKTADSLLRNAADLFASHGNKEGQTWVANATRKWQQDNRVEVSIQNGHVLGYGITATANPRFFATSGQDNLIKIWDRNLGKEILTISDNRDAITNLDFSVNGRYMASTAADSTVHIYNAYDYSLLNTWKVKKPERVIRFSPDSKTIVTAGADSLIKFRNLQTGEVLKTLKLHKGPVTDLCFRPGVDYQLYSSGTDSMVYKWDVETGEMLRWYKYKGKALSVKFSRNGKYMSVVSTDSLLTVRDAETNNILYRFNIATFKQGTSTYFCEESFSSNNKYLVFPTAKDSFIVVNLEDNYQRIYSTGATGYHLADTEFSSDGLSMYARFDLGGPLRVYNFAGWDIRQNTTINYKDIPSFANLLVGLQFTSDDNGLVVLQSDVAKINLQNGKKEFLYFGGNILENNSLLLHNENLGSYAGFTEPTLNIYNIRKQEIEKFFSLPAGNILSAHTISENDQKVFLGSKEGLVMAWRMSDDEVLWQKKYPDSVGGIGHIWLDEKQQEIFIGSDSSKIFVCDDKGGIKYVLPTKEAAYLSFTTQFLFVATNDGNLDKYSRRTGQLLHRSLLNDRGEFAYYLCVSPDEKTLYVQSGYTSLKAIDIATDSVKYALNNHTNQLTAIAVSHDGKTLATCGFDSKVNLYDAQTGGRHVNIYMPRERNCVIANDSGYYMAQKNALDAIIFSYNSRAYSFDQFDLMLNRPDKIMAMIGRADSATLLSYQAAWKKRLSRAGQHPIEDINSLHLPIVKLVEKAGILPVTTKNKFEFKIACADSRYAISSIQVLVNNSPALGLNGLDVSRRQSREVEESVSISLANGSNNIKVFCTNSNGQKSLNESFDVISNYKPARAAKTYFVGIGIDHYKDSSMNLRYSVKDIRDLAKSFNDLYQNIVIDTLINKNVTKANILALKKMLDSTATNDRVILAVTGHGMLDKNFDFYYATWNMDFASPAKQGLRYEDLEALLNNIPAQKKLLLIDACHSGALDKEELLAGNTKLEYNSDTTSVNGTAPRGVIKLSQGAAETNNSFQVMQNLFADLNGTTGTVVISAAGGMEYALESPQWNNGVFTYCVRKGIAEKAADSDGGNDDGKVSVQELQQYVGKKVSELTRGKQQPTSRRENVDFEWFLRY